MSVFAENLQILLDETDLFNRPEWAKFLGVKEELIEQWLVDEEIPRPSDIGMIVICLENASEVQKAKLVPFEEMSRRNALEVSPHGKRMLPTVEEYYKRPAFCELSSKLAKMNSEEKGDFLFNLYFSEKALESWNDLFQVNGE